MRAGSLSTRPGGADEGGRSARFAVAGALLLLTTSLALASPANGQGLGPIAGTEELVAVACPSASLCLGVGQDSNADQHAVAVPLSPETGDVVGGQSVQTIAGAVGALVGVACASPDLCLAVGGSLAVPLDPATGKVVSGQSVRTFSASVDLDAVACVSSTVCLAVGTNADTAGATLLLDPATGKVISGHTLQTISAAFNLAGVACASSSNCLGVGTSTSVSSSAVTVPLDPATGAVASGQSAHDFPAAYEFTAVACPSAADCLATGEDSEGVTGVALAVDPTTGAAAAGQSVQMYPGTFEFPGVGCLSEGLCLAVGMDTSGSGTAVPISPANGREPDDESIGGTYAVATVLLGVACASSVQCLAVGDGQSGGVAVSITFPVGSSGIQGQLYGVACASTTLCLGVGFGDTSDGGVAVPLNPGNGTVTSGHNYEAISRTDELRAVACASATLCLAVGVSSGDEGLAVPLDPATGKVMKGQSVQTIPATSYFNGVACPSANLCVGVGANSSDEDGFAVPLDPATGKVIGGQSVQAIAAMGAFNAVACPSAKLCLGVGVTVSDALGFGMAALDPGTGKLAKGQSVQGVSESGQLTGVACLSETLCLAAGRSSQEVGATVPVDPRTGKVATGEKSRAILDSGPFQGAACASAARCFAVGYDVGIETALLDPATGALKGGGLQDYAGNGELSGVACASATHCVAVGANGAGTSVAWALLLSKPSPPSVSSVKPSTGPVTGGTSITITGTGFMMGATVQIGQGAGKPIAATGVTVVSSSEITARTGGSAKAGKWPLSVVFSGQTSPLNAGDLFVYAKTSSQATLLLPSSPVTYWKAKA